MRHFWFIVCLIASAWLAPRAWADPDNYAAVERGRALATAGDCIACHTAPGGAAFAGGLGLGTPFGTILTANITPDDGTGIGRWSAEDFARAMQEGIRPDGGHLYPAFPYPYYTKLTRADTDAIYAYLRTVTPVTKPVDRAALPFPFDIRASMIAWNALFFTPGRFVPDPNQSAIFNRGAYLVQGAGHCGACHTPLNALGANKASAFLQSNLIDNWIAPNLTNDARLGIGSWSVDDIVTYLQAGRNSTNIASGPMAEVVYFSTSRMPLEDLRAIAVYLKAQAPAGASAATAVDAQGSAMRAGEAIYVDTCAACHTRAGSGIANLFPKLAHNPVVQQNDPTTLIRIVLTGAKGVVTATAPTAPAMPSLGYRLNDSEIAAVLTFVRNSWGNAAASVSASDVAALRRQVWGKFTGP